MRLRHIEVFHAIMRTGSLSKAAQLLCVSQPAVSKVLAHAEHSLGIRLFHRSHGRLHPTREAQLLFDETQKLQTNLDRVSVLARNLALRPGGHLRIGCLPSLGLSIIPHVVEKFRAICPDVSLRIDTRHTKELVTALLTRDLDLAVGIDPPSHPGITAVEVARSRIVIVGAPDKDGRALPNSLEGFVAMQTGSALGPTTRSVRLSELRLRRMACRITPHQLKFALGMSREPLPRAA
ncbi:DNA-binding transcriptional LysR family regulator [Paraburkholderia sp. JPY162]|uniref:DNA-binding transcriptional LysR family regulator n=1 Tax=Paraburkholderia youngii TaxID=2782701 RepID=A0A7W8LDN4_9BURK|nr:DNA-binding transcriptional LysR family regulator [Paraburkholderia youngii]